MYICIFDICDMLDYYISTIFQFFIIYLFIYSGMIFLELCLVLLLFCLPQKVP